MWQNSLYTLTWVGVLWDCLLCHIKQSEATGDHLTPLLMHSRAASVILHTEKTQNCGGTGTASLQQRQLPSHASWEAHQCEHIAHVNSKLRWRGHSVPFLYQVWSWTSSLMGMECEWAFPSTGALMNIQTYAGTTAIRLIPGGFLTSMHHMCKGAVLTHSLSSPRRVCKWQISPWEN